MDKNLEESRQLLQMAKEPTSAEVKVWLEKLQSAIQALDKPGQLEDDHDALCQTIAFYLGKLKEHKFW